MDQVVRRDKPPARPREAEDGQVDPRIGDEISRMLSKLKPPGAQRAPAPPRAAEAAHDVGGSLALGLAERIGKALRASGDRSRALEERMEGVIQRASEELENAHKRIESLEARLKAAEERERKLEARVRDGDQWMQRIYDTLSEQMAANPDLFADLTEAAGERPAAERG
jgi:hypothetical protein